MIHRALLHWGQWVSVNKLNYRQCGSAERAYRDDSAYNGVHEKPSSIQPLAAWKVNQMVKALPEKHKTAIQWHYVFSHGGHKPFGTLHARVSPHAQARRLAVPVIVLHDLVHAGRSMLKNRS